jgi:hypothetical protein
MMVVVTLLPTAVAEIALPVVRNALALVVLADAVIPNVALVAVAVIAPVLLCVLKTAPVARPEFNGVSVNWFVAWLPYATAAILLPPTATVLEATDGTPSAEFKTTLKVA